MPAYEETRKEILIPMGDTTMVDIYEAAGGTVNEDRTQVSIDPSKMKCFDIILRVYPSIVTHDMDGERITFGVILHDETALQPGPLGTRMRQIQYDAEVELPVSQVKIFKPADLDHTTDPWWFCPIKKCHASMPYVVPAVSEHLLSHGDEVE